jgi:hypothetical protein
MCDDYLPKLSEGFKPSESCNYLIINTLRKNRPLSILFFFFQN